MSEASDASRSASDSVQAETEAGPGAVEQYYRARIDRFADDERRLSGYDRILSRLRMVVFLISAALFLFGWASGASVCYYLGGAVLFGFVALATYHEFVSVKLETARQIRRINEEGIARLHRRWKELPEVPVELPASERAVANDLDLFGHASVFQLLCCAQSPVGISVLRDWLLEGADAKEIRLRQEAATELAPRVELREQLMLEGRLLAGDGQAIKRFVDWAESDPWLTRRPWLLWPCRILPLLVLIALGLTIASVLSVEIGATAVAGLLAVNFLVSVLFTGKAHDIFTRVSKRRGEAQRYLTLFSMLANLPTDAPKLKALQTEVAQRGGGVIGGMRQLNLIMSFASISHSPLLFIFAYLPLQLVMLYDFHVLTWLEGWQQQHGAHTRHWLRSLGEFEALASLAMLVHDHPQWRFPEVDPDEPKLTATSLGHPLLADASRIVNDVEVGPTGTFLLVTGSNMSGKSTLLRSIGVNAVLAQAGAPVCAQTFRMPRLKPATSMRVQDSLEDGVSFFMAELKRLKEIVDQAKAVDKRDNVTLLYLLDEILLGTNSSERHIAVVRVLAHLLDHRAIGAISTHDLELATSNPLTQHCQSVHFRETLHEGDAAESMTFDYKLRSGVATTTNALRLLKLVGLDEA